MRGFRGSGCCKVAEIEPDIRRSHSSLLWLLSFWIFSLQSHDMTQPVDLEEPSHAAARLIRRGGVWHVMAST